MPTKNSSNKSNNKKEAKNKSSDKKEILMEDELIEEVEPEIVHLKTKPVPAIVMLLAGLIASISTYVQRIPTKDSLIIILVVLIVFLILGNIIKMLLDKIEIVIPVEEEEVSEEEQEAEEPENIEKE